jgi:penicillin-binding protein 2
MWKMAEETGYAPIYKLLRNLGLGEETGVEVDYEVPGILPTDAWKQRHHGDVLRTGDIANLSIGQGFLNVTPVQMAQLTCALATGGRLIAPTLIRGFRDSETGKIEPSEPRKPARELNWPEEDVRAIREGMRAVVMNPRGTAHRTAHIPGLTYAGKTGTAQFGPRGNRRYRSWMIAFAPYENPRIAAVVLVDEGRGSGVDAAPRMKLLMQGLFGGRSRE